MYPNPQHAENVSRNRAIKEEILPGIDRVAEKTGSQVVDLYSLLSDRPEMDADYVHPNADGARLIAEALKTAIVN